MAKLRYRTLRENVVDEIRMKILNREYEPGMRIVEQNLSDELGVLEKLCVSWNRKGLWNMREM